MIYLNNAATSWPKPNTTIADLHSFWRNSPELWANQYKESHRAICDFFGIKDSSRFIITSGATASLNLVLSDLDWKKGDIVVTGSFEHHALGGWEPRLAEQYGVIFKRIKSTESEIFDFSEFESFMKKNHKRVKLAAFTHASNVTGDLVPMKEILSICQEYRVLSLLDAAQTAGIIEINIDILKPDIFFFAGHKGTMGPHGISGLYLSEAVHLKIPNAACEFNPGNENIDNNRYVSFPTHCDVGSINLEGMIALSSSLNYLSELGFDEINKIRDHLNNYVYNKLSEIDELEIISKSKLDRTFAIAFKTETAAHSVILKELAEKGCIIGAGFFCAPSAHIQLNTENQGVLRISAGIFTTEEEIDQFFVILRKLLSSYTSF